MARGSGQKGVIVFAYVQPFSVHLFTVNYGNVSRVDVEVSESDPSSVGLS